MNESENPKNKANTTEIAPLTVAFIVRNLIEISISVVILGPEVHSLGKLIRGDISEWDALLLRV
jgi:hypothetical protein